MRVMSLTAKQKAFVAEYLIDLNAKQAAIRAGYSAKTAKDIGCQNLAKLDIQKALKEAMDKRSERTEITQDMVLNELAVIGFSDMENYVDFGPNGVTLKELADMPKTHSRAISEVTHNFTSEGGGSVKFKLYDKQSALVNMGKHLGMFTDKLKLEGDLKVTEIVHTIVDPKHTDS